VLSVNKEVFVSKEIKSNCALFRLDLLRVDAVLGGKAERYISVYGFDYLHANTGFICSKERYL
jgi:hypothetical protein